MLGKGAVTAILLVSILVALAMVVGAWQLSSTRRAKAKMALNKDTDYRRLAEEYRRLAEMAVTAQEHTDLKLGDVTMQIGQVREQLESVQRILKDVE